MGEIMPKKISPFWYSYSDSPRDGKGEQHHEIFRDKKFLYLVGGVF
jgi:hypothetical protein